MTAPPASPRIAAVILAAEKIDRSYVCKTLRLNTLAPGLVEAVLDGTEPAGTGLERLL